MRNVGHFIINREMLASIKVASKLFKDVPVRPLDKAVWWIEYIIR